MNRPKSKDYDLEKMSGWSKFASNLVIYADYKENENKDLRGEVMECRGLLREEKLLKK